MRSFVRRLGDLVAARPAAVIGVVLVVTMVMVALAGQAQELDNSQESFAPPSVELDASRELQARFNDQLTIQVLVTSKLEDGDEGRPILTADGIATAVEVLDTIEAELGEVLVDDPTGPPSLVSFATPVLRAAEAAGMDPRGLSDAEVTQLFERGVAELPPAQRDLFGALLAGDDPSTAATGLVLANLDGDAYESEDDPDKAAQRDQLALVDRLDEVGEDRELDAIPFSFVLLQADDGSFLEEVRQLFGIAILIVLIVLAFVLRARRGQALTRAGAIRRTAADVALGLGVVVLANIWVGGLQVVLGPDGLGVVGAPSPPTNIVSILLIALGVDYAIHLQGRYREEVSSGDANPGEAARRTSRTVGAAILLGAVTTAVGFLTNLTSPLAPIRDLGVLAAVGLVAAFVLTTTFLPAVRVLLDRRAVRAGNLATVEVAASESRTLPRLALAMGGPALRNPWAVAVTAAVVTAMGLGALTNLETEFDIAAFLPEGSDNQRAFVLINEDFAGGLGEQTSVLIEGEDVATAEVHNAQVEALDALRSSEAVVVTGQQVAGSSVVHAVRQALALSAAPDAPPPVVAAVDRARDAGLADDGTITGDAAAVYAALAPTGLLDGVLDLDPESADDEPAVRIAVGTQTTRVGAKTIVADFNEALAPVVAAGPEVVVTSDLIINDNAIDALRSSQIRGLAIAFGVVLALLTLVYRRRYGSWAYGSLLMLPVGAVAVCTLGLMAVTGIPFDPVTATVSALVIGVGIDFTIHLGERFVEDWDAQPDDPVAALRASLTHTGSALAGSAFTTVLGFAVLVTGSIVPFQRLGSTTVYAVGLSLLAVVAVQPAILLLWIQRGGRLATAGEFDRPDDSDTEVASEVEGDRQQELVG